MGEYLVGLCLSNANCNLWQLPSYKELLQPVVRFYLGKEDCVTPSNTHMPLQLPVVLGTEAGLVTLQTNLNSYTISLAPVS